MIFHRLFMKNDLRKRTWKDWFRLFFRKLRQIRVDGNSMAPTLNHGDVVLYDPWPAVEVGDIVFTSHPFMQSVKIMKRIGQIDSDDNVTLIGDNESESTDSRTFGTVSIKSIKGRVVCKWK